MDSASLFRRHARFVASFVHRHGARGADLDDLVQEVFLNAHRKGGYRPGAATPTTFLANLALQALTQRRRQRARVARADDEAALALTGQVRGEPHADLTRKDALRCLSVMLEQMEPAQRAVFILFELEGESCAAIAAGLSIPLGTVHSRLHAARKTFALLTGRPSEPKRKWP